jgi:iron(III) transport system permease protein
LVKLGLGWSTLRQLYPALSLIEVVGAPGPLAEIPGHDLTDQAEVGFVNGMDLPPSLFADMGGALMASEAALKAVLLLKTSGKGTRHEVALSDAAAWLALPRQLRMTTPDGAVGGAHAGYRVYACKNGRVAVAALEPHFAISLCAAAGITLALMEMLADFGTVAIFNVDTFTTAIYKAWLNLFNLSAASQLASLLAMTVLLLVWLEQRARGQRRYTATGSTARASQQERIALSGIAAAMAFFWCALVLLLAFIVPVTQLLLWTVEVAATDWDTRYWGFIGHSLLLASLASVLVVAAGLWIAYAQRQHPGRLTQWWVRLSTLGYALPGMLLSVGLFVPIAWLDLQLLPLWQTIGVVPAPVIKGTLAVMLLALSARFMAVGFEPMQAAMQRITPNQEQAARSLGLNRWQTLRRLHLPMLRSGWLGASLLVFVEVMKEMPITLMTRPFGWDTLAVRVFEMSSEGMWERAALPSLCIVAAGLLPVIFLVRETEK